MESNRQKTFMPKRTAPLPSIVLAFTLLLFPNLFEADPSEIYRGPCVNNIKMKTIPQFRQKIQLGVRRQLSVVSCTRVCDEIVSLLEVSYEFDRYSL